MSENDEVQSATRRRFLKSAAGLATFATATTLMPWNMQKALAAMPLVDSPRLASLRQLKHVVLIMQENRSFDHYFGMLNGVRGFADRSAMIQNNGRSVFYQPDKLNPDGYLLPFHLNTLETSAQKVHSTGHMWGPQHRSWNEGKMNGFVSGHIADEGPDGQYCMGYYDRADIPFHYALADLFTVCDAYHCSVLGPTWPNRAYWMSGTIDAGGDAGGPYFDGMESDLRWQTYPERLERAGISWKVYRTKEHEGGPHPDGLNVLGKFRQFAQASASSPLYRKGGMEVVSSGQFEYDAYHNKLPAVSWVIPKYVESEHPDRMPARGAAFLASKLNAIASNMDTWGSTAVIISYDENDGMFDHVRPTTPSPGTPAEFVNGAPIGCGFRVPCIVVSPWTVGGWVCSELFDHTSQLRFLEKFTGVREPNISTWRRAHFGDMTSAFRFGHAAARPLVLPATAAVLRRAEYEAATLPKAPIPSVRQAFPRQDVGSRKRLV